MSNVIATVPIDVKRIAGARDMNGPWLRPVWAYGDPSGFGGVVNSGSRPLVVLEGLSCP